MSYLINEMVGTMMLVLLGDGVCCNVMLDGSGQKGGNSVHIGIGWGLAVLLPAFTFGAATGAHFNPSVTLAMAVSGALAWNLVPMYIIGQMIGGFLGAVILIGLYYDQLSLTAKNAGTANATRGCFCTGPSMKNYLLNAFSEFVCTFCLIFFIFGIGTTNAEMSSLNYVFVFCIIMSIGMSFGGLTGYSMNAARDFSPRLAWYLLAPGEAKDPEWSYSWIPAIIPILGGISAALVFSFLPL